MCHADLVRNILSRRRSRTSDASRPTRCYPEETDTKLTRKIRGAIQTVSVRPGAIRRVSVRLDSGGRDLAAPLAENVFRSGVRAIHESRHRERKRTRQADKNPTAGIREPRTKHPRKGRTTKISYETAKVLQHADSEPKRARRHRLVNCAVLFRPFRAKTYRNRTPGLPSAS